MANKTYSAYVSFDTPTLAKILTLNHALVRLWNIVKVLIDSRLKSQTDLKARGDISEEEKSKTGISYISLTYCLPKIISDLKKEGYPLTSDLARQLTKKLSGSYTSFFELRKKNDHRARVPREKDVSKDVAIMSWSKFKLERNTLSLLLPERGKLEIVIPENLLTRIGLQKPCYVFLKKIPQDDRWKLDVVVSYDAPTPTLTPSRFRAIDLGAGNVAVTDSNGTQYLVPTRRSEKFWMSRIDSVEKRMKNRTKGSRGYKRLARARRTMHNTANTQHKDHQRKLAHALCKDVDCIVIGKPRTRLGLAQSKKMSSKQHHGVQNTGYMSRLMMFIKEKCVERGIRYVELPDPIRVGSVIDPEAKFEASQKLLGAVLKDKNIPMPERFACKAFRFNQGGKKGEK